MGLGVQHTQRAIQRTICASHGYAQVRSDVEVQAGWEMLHPLVRRSRFNGERLDRAHNGVSKSIAQREDHPLANATASIVIVSHNREVVLVEAR